jgi:zinc protease
MKTIFALVLTLTLTACGSGAKRPDSGTTDSGGAGGSEFKIRKFDTQTLANGLTILWLPDNALPYVAFQVMFKIGSAQDPKGKEGVASFTATMLDKGTAKRSATRLSEDLEQIGSGFGAEAQPDYTMASISSLSFDKDTLLETLREILLTPTFPQAEIERQRKIRLASLQKLADRPEDFSEYLMPKFLYGNHPYGHESVGTPGTIKKLKRADLVDFYAKNFRPDNAVLAVVGQYDESWKSQVVSKFSQWKGGATKSQEVPDFPQWKGRELLLVERSDLNQAQIQIGFRGIPRNMPEYQEFRAAIKILGESFGSRLFEEIRVKRGLTYHIHAWFDPRLKPGPMGIYTFTRTDKTAETVQETINTYRQFVANGVTDQEVSDIKNLMKGQFPRMFETPEALAGQLLVFNRYGIGVDYLTDYLRNLDAINKDSVNATIRKYFDADNLRILVYAPKGKSAANLKTLGKLEIKGYKEFLQ